MIKSNSMSTSGQLTNWKNNYTTVVLSQGSTFWVLHQAACLGVEMGGGHPQNLALKENGVWSQGFHRTRGNGNSTFEWHTQDLMHTRIPIKKWWPHKRLDKTYLLALEGLSVEAGGGYGLLLIQNHQWQQSEKKKTIKGFKVEKERS